MKVPRFDRFETPHEPSRLVFALCALVFFILLLSAAESVGFVPYYIDGTAPAPRVHTSTSAPTVVTDLGQLADMTFTLTGDGTISAPAATPRAASAAAGVAPARLMIDDIDLDLPIQNPATTDVDALDELLKDGPARYASSALLGERGNMIIFAHSSHLPIVHNQMYKAFNRIPELASGAAITLVDTGGTHYLYRVVSIRKVDVGGDATISLATDATRLTLVTCDTLAGKSARFVLDAEYVGII